MISKEEFPLLTNQANLIYLDNAATTQKPNVMMQAITHYYITANANVGRGAYDLAHTSEEILNSSRQEISSFFNAKESKLVFTSGATESLNLAAYSASEDLEPGDVVILSIWDHHANILPWQHIAKTKKLKLKYIEDIKEIYNPQGTNDKFWDKVKVLAIPHVPNTIGNIFPVKEWVQEAKKHNVTTIIDGAQAVSSISVDIDDIGADFYAFSAHKLYGPMGLGCLFISQKQTQQAKPLILGGGIIEDVFKNEYVLKDGQEKLEAGTPDVANAYAFAQTLKWLKLENWEKNLENIKKYNDELLAFVKDNPNIITFNHTEYPHIAMTTIRFKDVHSHDVGTFLSNKNIAVRVGKHCAYPFHKFIGEKHSVRFSFGIYNTKEDMEQCKEMIEQAIRYFVE